MSLVEIMVGLTLLLGTVAVTAPASSRWLSRMQVRSTSNTIALTIARARLATVSQRSRFVVTFDAVANTFTTFSDDDEDAVSDPAEAVIADASGRLAKEVSFVHPSGGDAIRVDIATANCDCIGFEERGYMLSAVPPITTAAIYVGDRFGFYQRVVIGFAGSVRVETRAENGSWQ